MYLKYIKEYVGDATFEGKRILVIHSGGDSKRIPQYSACGKLFSPIPRELPDGRGSTLFDELLISTSGMPARMKDGLLVISGDVLLIFNPLQIDFYFGGVAAISIKEDAKTGQNHGVYLGDGKDYVKNFLHKLSIPELEHYGAVNEYNQVDIDTGAVLLGSDILENLYSVVCTENKIDKKNGTYL